MAAILTPEDVVRRIAAECTFIDERGAVGLRLKPAAAIVRRCGEQFRAPASAALGHTAASALSFDHIFCNEQPVDRAGSRNPVKNLEACIPLI
jgi:hypothetical protein